jgi:hypothetical protein
VEKSNNLLLRSGLVLAFCLGSVLSARGFALEGSWWHTSTIPMRVQMGSSDVVLADGSVDFNSSIENALLLWNQQISGIEFTWTVAPTGTAASAGDGVNSMQFSSTVYGDKFGANVLAITLINSSGDATLENDVIFNTANKFNSYRDTSAVAGTQGSVDIHRIALHELGHVLGLDHPDENGQNVVAIMNSIVSTVDTLQADDVAGAVSRYGAPANPPPTTGDSQILEISTRGLVGTGDNVMIGGFIIQDTSTTKKVLIRAIGPSLGAFGISGTLTDPVLELHDSTGLLQTNDNWKERQEQEIIDTTLPPTDDRESAIVADLGSGGYTAILTGMGGTAGIALVEVYDLDPDNGKIGNISTRARVETGDNVLIGGFIVESPQSQKVVVRALGPSLAAVGVSGALSNPTLEIYNADGDLMISNDNYPNAVNAETIGSYHLYPPITLESAAYFEGAPGNYTTIVRGLNGVTGIGLVEVYGVR